MAIWMRFLRALPAMLGSIAVTAWLCVHPNGDLALVLVVVDLVLAFAAFSLSWFAPTWLQGLNEGKLNAQAQIAREIRRLAPRRGQNRRFTSTDGSGFVEVRYPKRRDMVLGLPSYLLTGYSQRSRVFVKYERIDRRSAQHEQWLSEICEFHPWGGVVRKRTFRSQVALGTEEYETVSFEWLRALRDIVAMLGIPVPANS